MAPCQRATCVLVMYILQAHGRRFIAHSPNTVSGEVGSGKKGLKCQVFGELIARYLKAISCSMPFNNAETSLSFGRAFRLDKESPVSDAS